MADRKRITIVTPFLGSAQLLCLGIIGEYVGSIYTPVQNRPLVIEKERLSFS